MGRVTSTRADLERAWLGPDPAPGSVGRSPNATEEGSVDEEGRGEGETVNPYVAYRVPNLDLGGGEDLAEVFDEVVPAGAGGEGEETVTGPFDQGRTDVKA